MMKFTFKEFMNREFAILVNSENIEHVLNYLSKTNLKWLKGEKPNEFNPFVKVEDLIEKYICLYVCCGSLFFNRHIDKRCPLIGVDHLIIEDDDLNKNDFIGCCVKSIDIPLCSVGKLYYFKDGITTLDTGRTSLKYDSIESFNKRNDGIEMVEVKEVKRKAKVGEYVKVVDPYEIPKTNGTLDYDVGSILKIINIDEDGNCHYLDRFGSFLYDDEYVVLEGYKDFKEDKIEVGDMVEVVNEMKDFINYPEWFKETGNLEYKNHFVSEKYPSKNKRYKVVCKGAHRIPNLYPDGVYCIQDLDTTQVFLVCKDGIKKY